MSIWNQLRERYPAPEWAIFFEVANGPGSTLRRYADAIAMSLFPSRGLDIHGFEIKTNRGDWLKELKTPQKAEAIAAYCDFWWVVSGSREVVLKDEIPRNWGLLVSNDGALRQVKRSERLDPKPLDRKFVGAILRRADEWTKRELRNDVRIVKAKEEGIRLGKEEAEWQNANAKTELNTLRKRLEEFENISGINIDSWQIGNVGEAVKAFLWAQKHDSVDELEKAANWIENSAKKLRDYAGALKAARPKKESEVKT